MRSGGNAMTTTDVEADERLLRADPSAFRREAQRIASHAEFVSEPRLRDQLAALVLTYLALARELERAQAILSAVTIEPNR
jgi:hypothetical protein